MTAPGARPRRTPLLLAALAGFLPLLPAAGRGEGQPLAPAGRRAADRFAPGGEGSREAARLLDAAGVAMRRARETGDPTWYGHAAAAADRAFTIAPADHAALRTKAWVLMGLHEFAAARALAEDAVAREPRDWRSWANLTDALVELGEYERAVAAADRLGALRPGVVAYTRIAGLQALLGDRRTAIATLGLAVAAAAHAEPETLAWTLAQLGHEHRALGELDAAGAAYERALAAFPDHHLALLGLARTRAAEGRLDDAVALAHRTFERVPTPEVAGLLANLHAARGEPAAAERQLELVDVMERLAAARGASYGRETALVLADHDRDLRTALRVARADVARRPDVYGDDVLAWTLHKVGRHREAKRAAARALRLGTEEASFHYHAGMIAAALGRPRAAARRLARALELGPRFDPRQAPLARAALAAARVSRLAAAHSGGPR